MAIQYVLEWEDSTLSGVITTKKRTGKRTRFGIDETFHPELTNSLYYTSMGKDPALEIADVIYKDAYAGPLCIENIVNQDVANKLLSMGVHVGVERAAKMLQDALKVPGDGRIGPVTLHTLECANQRELLVELRDEAEYFYKRVVELHPEDAIYLKGWLRRAAA